MSNGAEHRAILRGNALEDENSRLRAIEIAARRFIKEADENPRYITVKTWATPEADPYLKFRAVLLGRAYG